MTTIEDINVGGISEALNNKADRDLNNLNIPDNIDYVIERGGGADKWYRKWKSGWLEQGGFHTDGDVASSITFLKEYNNVKYVIVAHMIKEGTSAETGNDVTPRLFNQTKKGFGYRLMVTNGNGGQGNRNWSWYACGYAE